jgi:RNA-directed DNA polymerase
MTFAQIEAAGLEAWLAGLREELVSKRYRPDAVRRVMIPKPNGGGERALGIPTPPANCTPFQPTFGIG